MDADHELAAREAGARAQLVEAGASSLPSPPWRHKSEPPSAVELIRFAAWRASADDATDQLLMAALTQLSAARSEVDQTEAALLFAARAQGLSWSQISEALGLRSPQAAQQRFERVAGRAPNLNDL